MTGFSYLYPSKSLACNWYPKILVRKEEGAEERLVWRKMLNCTLRTLRTGIWTQSFNRNDSTFKNVRTIFQEFSIHCCIYWKTFWARLRQQCFAGFLFCWHSPMEPLAAMATASNRTWIIPARTRGGSLLRASRCPRISWITWWEYWAYQKRNNAKTGEPSHASSRAHENERPQTLGEMSDWLWETGITLWDST